MSYFKVPVYKATVCNTKPFANIENLGETVVEKSNFSSRVEEPMTGVEILVQRSRFAARGLIKMNQDQIAQNGFCLFVYQKHLIDKNLVTKKDFEQWTEDFAYSSVYQCCQDVLASNSKLTYGKTIRKRRR